MEAAPHHLDDDVEDDSGLQTEKLVSAGDNAVSRMSSPTSDSDPIELDKLAWQDQDSAPDGVEQPPSPGR